MSSKTSYEEVIVVANQWSIWEDPSTTDAYFQLLQRLEKPWEEGKMYGRVYRLVGGEPYLSSMTFRITGLEDQITDVTLWKDGAHEEFAIRNDSDEYGWISYHFKDPTILEQLTEKLSEVGLALATNGQRVQVVLEPKEAARVSTSNRYPGEDFGSISKVACPKSHNGLHILDGTRAVIDTLGMPMTIGVCRECGCLVDRRKTHTYQ